MTMWRNARQAAISPESIFLRRLLSLMLSISAACFNFTDSLVSGFCTVVTFLVQQRDHPICLTSSVAADAYLRYRYRKYSARI